MVKVSPLIAFGRTIGRYCVKLLF